MPALFHLCVCVSCSLLFFLFFFFFLFFSVEYTTRWPIMCRHLVAYGFLLCFPSHNSLRHYVVLFFLSSTLEKKKKKKTSRGRERRGEGEREEKKKHIASPPCPVLGSPLSILCNSKKRAKVPCIVQGQPNHPLFVGPTRMHWYFLR